MSPNRPSENYRWDWLLTLQLVVFVVLFLAIHSFRVDSITGCVISAFFDRAKEVCLILQCILFCVLIRMQKKSSINRRTLIVSSVILTGSFFVYIQFLFSDLHEFFQHCYPTAGVL